MVPVLKKGERNRVEEYRGVTLARALCKIYAEILAGRVREEVEKKKLVPENQAGFRKGKGTMDNILLRDGEVFKGKRLELNVGKSKI